MPYKPEIQISCKTVEIKKTKINSGIVHNYRSKNRKENNIAVFVEAENTTDMKEIAEDLRELIRKKNRLLNKGLSYQIHCSIKSNE